MGRIKKILVPNKIPAGTSFKEDEISNVRKGKDDLEY